MRAYRVKKDEVVKRYPMQPDPQTLNDSFTVSPAKKATKKPQPRGLRVEASLIYFSYAP